MPFTLEAVSDEQAFLDAIRAAPNDDAPRLVYADWLLERGDPRGEALAAQCTVARLEATRGTGTDEYRRAVVAEALCVEEAEARWLQWLGIPERYCLLFRGLPAVVSMNAMEHAFWPSLARLPLLQFKVHGAPDMAVVREIAALPGIEALESVAVMNGAGTVFTLDAKTLGPAMRDARTVAPIFGALAPPPPLDHVCTKIELSVQETDAMFGKQRLPSSLRSFKIQSAFHDVEELVELFGPERRSFEELRLLLKEDCSFEPLWQAWPFEGVSRLVLHSASNPRAPNGAEAFAANRIGRSLREFGGTIFLDDTLADALADAPLEELYLHGGGTLSALERVLALPLRKLSLEGFEHIPEAIALVAAKAPPTLAYLVLDHLPRDRVSLLASPRLSQLTQLALGDLDAKDGLAELPELARVPWLQWRRSPAPNVWPHWRRP